MFDFLEKFFPTRRRSFILLIKGDDFTMRTNFGTLTAINTLRNRYLVRACPDNSVKELYIVPQFIDGKGREVSLKGPIYNHPDIPNGETRRTSVIDFLTIEEPTNAGSIITRTVHITGIRQPKGTMGLLTGVVVKSEPAPPAWWHRRSAHPGSAP